MCAQTSITSGVTGAVWLDRNLGATQVATSLTDTDASGDLYQWGRVNDGHQLRTATTAAGQIATGSEGSTFYFDGFAGNWLTVADDNRWQPADITNNPCPTGYRVPTSAEFIAEGFTDAATAFASDLKLPYTGFRSNGDGNIYDATATGYYWTSTISTTNAIQKFFNAGSTNDWGQWRSAGLAVRCIFDAILSSPDIKLLDFNMYPNPIKNGTQINFNTSIVTKNVKVSVYDVTGKEIHSQNDDTRTINLSNTSKGVYLVKFILDNKTVIVKELIIK